MASRLDDTALKQLFFDARTLNAFQAREVPDALLKEIVDTMKLGPTSANCQPARIIFVKSKAAKERLKPHLSDGNRDKTMRAPVTAIIGFDLSFYEHLPRIFPHNQEARSWFAGSIQGPCRASTMPASIRNFSPTATSNPISYAILATAIRPGCLRAALASRSRRSRKSSSRSMMLAA
jgi:nitroreductase